MMVTNGVGAVMFGWVFPHKQTREGAYIQGRRMVSSPWCVDYGSNFGNMLIIGAMNGEEECHKFSCIRYHFGYRFTPYKQVIWQRRWVSNCGGDWEVPVAYTNTSLK